MSDIRRLDDATVDRIAAGEVVERPASVVKELVENSVDASANRVEVRVKTGGTERIEVRDDGHGMSGEDLELAVAEHATSKIRDVTDLEAGVGTLGFRGEALHAIGAVSRLTIRSRERNADRGAELRVEGGEVISREPVGCPVGTSVVVEDLFYNVPARRKYLKTEATEFGRVNRVVSGYALANPDVAVSLAHNGRETFATEGRGDRRAAIMAVYGREVAAGMVPVEGTDETGPLNGVTGLVSHPETNRASREYIHVFVNGRWVTASAVREAVVDAYGRQLASDRYPFAVVNLDIDPASVDVNVHPRKLEVRFADESGMRQQVRDAVESALLDAGLIRSSAPRGRSKVDQTEIRQGESTDDELNGERGASDSVSRGTGQSGGSGETRASTGDEAGTDRAVATDAMGGGEAKSSRGADESAEPSSADDRRFHAATQTTLDGTDPDCEFDRLPAMRVLGQLHDTYLVAETDDGLVLVDQHAADERVNYERLREQFADDVQTQALAEPVVVSLTPREAALAEPARETLAQLGFTIRLEDARTLRVETVPALLADAVEWDTGASGPSLVRDLLDDFAEGDPERTVEAAVDDLLGDLACYPAVTGNVSLTEGDTTALLTALDDCENPYACPHGRPVVVEVSRDEITERFERDYPGHGG
ncbi:DNA mismatch repair endonuclease MutL [Halosegnis sp.]|uniref:DNA mismatch repair endonuclease MutL n=1 Tax=Halosegnis sp. TaxID=2864959 RepID=UPI0035D47056